MPIVGPDAKADAEPLLYVSSYYVCVCVCVLCVQESLKMTDKKSSLATAPPAQVYSFLWYFSFCPNTPTTLACKKTCCNA